MSWAVAEELRFVVLRHRDPADRFLAATAPGQDLTLVTADRMLMEMDGVRILPKLLGTGNASAGGLVLFGLEFGQGGEYFFAVLVGIYVEPDFLDPALRIDQKSVA